MQGQAILISSPSGSHVRPNRVPPEDQLSTPIRARQPNNIIRLDKNQSVQFVKNGQIHTATATSGGNHQIHHVQTSGGGARRILPIRYHIISLNSKNQKKLGFLES